MGAARNQTSTVADDRMGDLNASAIGMQKTLQTTILRVAGTGHSNGGQVLADLIALTHAPNSWRNQAVGWKKWQVFCQTDQTNPMSADEPALLRYIGWLYSEGRISGASLRGYLSSVFSAYKKLGVTLHYTPLIQMAIKAYQTADGHRRAQSDPTSGKERCGIPATVMKRIADAALIAPISEIKFIRAASAVVVSYMFLERGEAGASLMMNNIRVTPTTVHLAIPLRKAGPLLTPHTLTYTRWARDQASPIDLVQRYDVIRRNSATRSTFYWSLPLIQERFARSSNTITRYLKECLDHLTISPPPQVSWSSHSLRIGAASEAAAINIPLYRIRIWGDWSPSSKTFEVTYLDARFLATQERYYFFGHLLGRNLAPSGPSNNETLPQMNG